MKYRRKQTIILLLILLFAFMGIGYAFITTTLNIDGTTDVDANTWNVYWNNVQVTDSNISNDNVIIAPIIDTNSKTMVNFHIKLKEPGDYYEFTVDAVNDGSIDAMVDTISKTVNGGVDFPPYINYTVTYSDGVAIEKNQLLKAGATDTYKVRVEYRDDINPTALPSTFSSFALSFNNSYIQANSNSKQRLYCGFQYPEGKNYSTIVPGDVIYTMTERFVVAKRTDNYILAVPHYNIELTTNYPVQSKNAGGVAFADTKYWDVNSIDMYYKADGINYSNNVQQYIDAYDETIKMMCGKNFTTRIMVSSDYVSSNKAFYNYNSTGSYWVGTPYPPDYDHGFIYIINSKGALSNQSSIVDNIGVRPVLEIRE